MLKQEESNDLTLAAKKVDLSKQRSVESKFLQPWRKFRVEKNIRRQRFSAAFKDLIFFICAVKIFAADVDDDDANTADVDDDDDANTADNDVDDGKSAMTTVENFFLNKLSAVKGRLLQIQHRTANFFRRVEMKR